MAGALSQPRSARLGAGRGGRRRPGIRSATTSALAVYKRSRGEAVARHDGRLPDDEATLRSFKGIGAYTAGAVLSFAFRQRAAILDTNVARVLFRVFIRDGELKSHAMTRQLWEISRAVLPRGDVFDFNQALMDLGAIVCTARKPRCLVCPMEAMCQTRGRCSAATNRDERTTVAAASS